MILLLDIDGVLQFPRVSFRDALEREYTWATNLSDFLGDLFHDPEYIASLEGRADFRTVADRILARHTTHLRAEEFLHRWAHEGIELNQAFLDAIPTLRFDSIYLASNQEPLRGAHVESLHSHAWLTGTFLSHRVGYSKPSPDYFERVVAQLQCAPEACVFIDDSLPNVEAAAASGMRAIHFTSTEQALAALRSIVKLASPPHRPSGFR